MRDWWLASAKTGNAGAIAALEERPFPDPIAYLWRWVMEIRRGLGMEGLTWSAVQAWAWLNDRDIEPQEVEAMFMIDAALRDDGSTEKQKPAESQDSHDVAVPRKSAWPTKKPTPETE